MAIDAVEIESNSLERTSELGTKLAACLFPGAVVGLVGPLGAGKTHLVRAIVAGLGGDVQRVSSPTFALIHEYAARMPVFHFDAYRLPKPGAFADLGAEEYFAGEGVCLIEWADRVEDILPADQLRIVIEHLGPTNRRFTLTAFGEPYLELLRQFNSSLEQT
jgi:tRNA threonylcarbamoyladenosine biosynthesis protein TsaE